MHPLHPGQHCGRQRHWCPGVSWSCRLTWRQVLHELRFQLCPAGEGVDQEPCALDLLKLPLQLKACMSRKLSCLPWFYQGRN